MSRFKIIEKPQALPGVDFLSGIHEDEFFVDLDYNTPGYGAFYLSKTTLVELAELIDYVPKTHKQETVDALQKVLEEYAVQFASMHSVLESVDNSNSQLRDTLTRAEELVLELRGTPKTSKKSA